MNNEEIKNRNIKFDGFNLTKIRNVGNRSYWVHTSARNIVDLLYNMNILFEELKISLSNKNNKEPSKLILSKLYWLFMQTCPFERGSAAISEIIFSALLQKYFGCNFKLLSEPYNPRHIPGIHALTYPIEKFQDFFWEKLVSKNNNSRPGKISKLTN